MLICSKIKCIFFTKQEGLSKRNNGIAQELNIGSDTHVTLANSNIAAHIPMYPKGPHYQPDDSRAFMNGATKNNC